MKRMKLVTVATHHGGYFSFLKKSCQRYDADLIILGWGQKWTGFSMKFKLMIDFLKNVPPDELVCFIDAYDVILLRPLDELEEFFRMFYKTMGSKIIIGCDKAHWATHILSSHVFGKVHGKVLNSGTYIGFAKDLYAIISNSYHELCNDDQILLNEYAILHSHDVHIDSDSLFFLTINHPLGRFMTKDMMVSNYSLMYQGVRPFFAHGNGNTDMNELITLLGYKIFQFDKSRLQLFKSKEVVKKFKHFLPYFYTVIITVIIMIIMILFVVRKRKYR